MGEKSKIEKPEIENKKNLEDAFREKHIDEQDIEKTVPKFIEDAHDSELRQKCEQDYEDLKKRVGSILYLCESAQKEWPDYRKRFEKELWELPERFDVTLRNLISLTRGYDNLKKMRILEIGGGKTESDNWAHAIGDSPGSGSSLSQGEPLVSRILAKEGADVTVIDSNLKPSLEKKKYRLKAIKGWAPDDVKARGENERFDIIFGIFKGLTLENIPDKVRLLKSHGLIFAAADDPYDFDILSKTLKETERKIREQFKNKEVDIRWIHLPSGGGSSRAAEIKIKKKNK